MPTITRNAIVTGLNRVGLQRGNAVLVHSSLSSFGHVEEGADAVIDALLETVGEDGTVLVPTLTGNEELSPEHPPTFDPLNTPCWTGRIPETFRMRASAVRSFHPTHSVAAIGADAEELIKDHIYSITPCDALSPYGKLAQQENGYILLLGVDHDANTTMHHIEEIVGVDYVMQAGLARAMLVLENETVTRHYLLHKYGPGRNFNVIDSVLAERGIQRVTQIGTAEVRLIAAKPMVQVVTQCLKVNPHILCQK